MAYVGRFKFGNKTRNQRYRLLLNAEEADSVPYSAVVLNIAWDGTHTGQDAVDDSETPHTLTWGTNALLSNVEKVFGATSYRSNGEGMDITAPNHADWSFGQNDFCVEMHLWAQDFISNLVAIGTYTATNGWWVRVSSTGDLEWGNGNTVVYQEALGGVASAQDWFHVAFTREGTDLRVFVNGTQLGATVTDSSDIISTVTLKLGELGDQQTWNGYIDSTRITKGYARYTEDFDAPTEAYPTE